MRVSDYLWFNYCFENFDESIFDNWDFSTDTEFNYTAEEAVKRFNFLFDKLCFNLGQKKHLVPISGGYDSRAILAALVERIPINNIETISFGFPGQLDYEIGSLVSKFFGIKKHNKFNLLDVKINWSSIVSQAYRSPTTFHFDALFNSLSRNLFSDKHYIIWSGFMGDPLAGSHLTKTEEPELEIAIQKFVINQKKIKSIKLEKPDLSAIIPWMQNIISKNQLRPDDVVNFTLRQAHCIAPIVLPLKKWKKWNPEVGLERNGAQVMAPFVDMSWASYWLYAPAEIRLRQKLYLEMLNQLFPDAMALPSKNSFGLLPSATKKIYIKSRLLILKAKLNRRIPMFRLTRDIRANYVDYGDLFRKRDDYIAVLEKAFDILISRNVMSRSESARLFKEHKKASANHAEFFCLIIGLAANIDANSLSD